MTALDTMLQATGRVFLLMAAAFVVTMAWTPVFTRLLYRYKLGKNIRLASDAPVYAKLHAHKAGTPTMGGVLIWVTTLAFAVVLALAAALEIPVLRALHFLSREETLLPLGVLVATAVVGLGDDLLNIFHIGPKGGGLRMRHRVILYAAIAAVGAWWFVAKLEWTTTRIPFVGSVDLGWWFVPFAMLVLFATAFSVNEIDGLDGLAGGTVLMAYGAYGAIAFLEGHYHLAALIGVLIGGLLAFLWFNIPPARFFMGDTGAMPLGITLGVIALLTNEPFLLFVIGFPFVLESLSVIVQTIAKRCFGRRVFRSTPLHHHLEAIGWPESKIVMRFWVISGVMAVVGLTIFLLDRSSW
ncbi:phospho-N-acetylmuramoyl-pentapeptide-transferase [Candidatus Uhrbacteria bacterium]|nr:phospho-N-acetylmuramoyl-pentapeptide-transferase [Candidatus Uhrbacteria bacterium]